MSVLRRAYTILERAGNAATARCGSRGGSDGPADGYWLNDPADQQFDLGPNRATWTAGSFAIWGYPCRSRRAEVAVEREPNCPDAFNYRRLGNLRWFLGCGLPTRPK